MLRFQFRLDGLLRIRRHREEERELALAAISGRCLGLEMTMRELAAEKARHTACSLGGLMMGYQDLQARMQYLRRIERDFERARAERSGLEAERVKAQTEYIEASRERKILDKLKERRSVEYYKKQLYEESKFLDEVGQIMHGRARAEE
jgi:flagellar FliJ protein